MSADNDTAKLLKLIAKIQLLNGAELIRIGKLLERPQGDNSIPPADASLEVLTNGLGEYKNIIESLLDDE